jgi:hypothetical protein
MRLASKNKVAIEMSSGTVVPEVKDHKVVEV